MIKVAAIYVGIHPKEASDNGPDCITEVPRKGNAYQQVSDISTSRIENDSCLSCWEIQIRRRASFVPNSSEHQHILVQGALLGA